MTIEELHQRLPCGCYLTDVDECYWLRNGYDGPLCDCSCHWEDEYEADDEAVED